MSPVSTMSGVDALVADTLLPMRERVLDALESKHPKIFALINSIMSNHKNKIGLQVTENGRVVGEYTFHLGGIRISNVEYGMLSSEIHHPLLGLVKPYFIIERNALEKIVSIEKELVENVISSAAKYMPEILPDVTIKFMR